MASRDHCASNWLQFVSMAPSLAAAEDAAGLVVWRVVQKTRRDVCQFQVLQAEIRATK